MPRYLLMVAAGLLVFNNSVADINAEQRCLLNQLQNADPATTVGELQAVCKTRQTAVSETSVEQLDESTAANTGSMIGRRRSAEQAAIDNPFVLTPHKQNYVLLASYNASPNSAIYHVPESEFDRYEMKFQLSFKLPVIENLFGTDADLYAAYTNLSFWQAYNSDFSSPFRETNHEPEMFFTLGNDWQLFGWNNSLIMLGAVHQSNGKSGYKSRSWNRLYANFIFERGNTVLSFKPWLRINERTETDDNPDIKDYLGHGEFSALYKHGKQTMSLMLRNNFSTSKGALQLDWSFPLYKRWRGYLQYFTGYGESLIDYNVKNQRLGFGLQLTDWL